MKQFTKGSGRDIEFAKRSDPRLKDERKKHDGNGTKEKRKKDSSDLAIVWLKDFSRDTQ